MTRPAESNSEKAPSLARAALDGGMSAISTATSGAKAGARLAVGTLFAGCNVLLDLGVRATRRLPLDGNGAEVHLQTAEGEVPALAIDDGNEGTSPIGWWIADDAEPRIGDEALREALLRVRQPLYVIGRNGEQAVGLGGRAVLGADTAGLRASYPLRAYAPALDPASLGDPAFRGAHRLRYAYVAGAMANGIGSEEIVEAMSRAGMLGFFGAAGLSVGRVEAAIDRIQSSLGDAPYGFNLIHSPNEPAVEAAVVDLYLRRGVRLVSASAYLDLTLPLVRYRVTGIHREQDGRIVCPNKVMGKVSRVEVARKFLSPPPESLLKTLVDSGDITAQQAELARAIPVATDLTVEADSGGHTDNRPAVALLPTMIALRDELQAKHDYAEPLRIGAAGGISTPASAAAAFAMGAAYVLTGSVNQACVEAGTSAAVRAMLAEVTQADVTMAPAADMFEMGVKLQVLKRGTMFPMRARKLYELYRAHAGLEELPVAQKTVLERDYFRCTLAEAWDQTRRYFESVDPEQIARAGSDPKHKMALVFRSYLGQSSNWANSGEPSRKVDYQVWCGPAMGAFNEWVSGSFLEKPENRSVVVVAMNILLGASVLARMNWLRSQGATLPPTVQQYRPRPLEEIQKQLSVNSGQ
ncbi:MAG: PfaD family polyunsaturated fatty acid/polyketide biosynthesis protein [Phycisphaerales bacterium]|nr:PfaD family polyunsaturated fatty acid/polyketide biosynthesis protein [Phycisphaerales bacterium]